MYSYKRHFIICNISADSLTEGKEYYCYDLDQNGVFIQDDDGKNHYLRNENITKLF